MAEKTMRDVVMDTTFCDGKVIRLTLGTTTVGACAGDTFLSIYDSQYDTDVLMEQGVAHADLLCEMITLAASFAKGEMR